MVCYFLNMKFLKHNNICGDFILNNFIDLVDNEKLLKDCNYLYSIPELGFELHKTKEYVQKELNKMGIDVIECGKCGLTATIGKGKRCVLLRADMDAIDIEGKGAFHGCGHHMHTSMLLGAARILKGNEGKLKNTVKLMFQPAEEILEGALDMINSGVLENPRPDAAFMIHMATAIDIPCGSLIFPGKGNIAPAADYFEVNIEGKGCHGSQPNKGYDPITASAQVVTALSNIRSRELAAKENAMLTIGCIRGGGAPNAIAPRVSMGGTMRAYDDNTRKFLKQRLEDITTNICTAMRTKGSVNYTRGCPSLVNDEALLENIMKLATELFGKDQVIDASLLDASDSSAGSEDFSYVSQKIPSVMVSLAGGQTSKGYKHPLHHPEVKFDTNALCAGSALMAYIGINL